MLTIDTGSDKLGRSFADRVRARYAFWVGAFFLLSGFCCGFAWADGFNGSVDFNYNSFESKTSGPATGTIESTTNSFKQTYNLWLNKTIFPNLRLDVGGLFEKVDSTGDTNGEKTDTTLTRASPFFDLRLDSPLYTAGFGFRRREDTVESTGSPSITRISDNYVAALGWRPEDFPNMDMRFERVENYDTDRSLQDSVNDNISLNMNYDAIDGLEVRYSPRYTQTDDRLNDLEIKEFTHNGRVNYNRQFFNQRVALYAGYRISRTDTETVSAGAGEVITQLFPFAGLSAIDATPADGALSPNSALIDGNLAASAGLNIGLPPPAGNTDYRNAGLEFASATELNTLYVWVNQELPGDINSSYTWEVYTSTDNQNWTLIQTFAPAPFGGTFQNRFEMNLSNITTRFLKVAVRPLSPTVPGATDPQWQNIFVTEMQAFIRRPVDSTRQDFSRTTQTYELDAKTKILEMPSLYYDFSLFTTRQEPSALTRFFLSNGLSLNHRFSRIFSGRARVAREDTQEAEDTVSYRYDASLTATPLERLSHILNYSGRFDEVEGENTSQHSIYLGNSAELYKGVNMNLNLGLNRNKSATGETSDNTTITWNAAIVPHSKLTMNVNYSDTTTRRTGGEGSSSSTSSRRGDLSLSYTPFNTLFFFLSSEMIQNQNGTDTAQHYGFNWSPFPNGALQFNFAYDENIREERNEKDRIIRPSLRWNMFQGAYLDLSYQNVMNSSDLQNTDTNVLSARLRYNF